MGYASKTGFIEKKQQHKIQFYSGLQWLIRNLTCNVVADV